jgi:GNAT superfamily N-acetyltransferase
MSTQPDYQLFQASNAAHLQALVEVWNAACPSHLTISLRFARYNVGAVTGGAQSGQLALLDGAPIGVVLVSHLTGDATVMAPDVGWIDCLAVTPQAQRQGVGTALLTWAEQWLAERGCNAAVLGTSIRPFLPGVPVELEAVAFFQRHDYQPRNTVWDVAANLATYKPPADLRDIDGIVRPGQPGEEEALLTFLRREFPGRWRFEYEELQRAGQRFSDYMLVWTERGVDGFCVLTFEDSLRPLERFYPYQLPRPWGQLGSVGVSAASRGRGYGLAVVDAGLRRLHNNGINGCVIDWTTIVDFYGKFGFSKYREYQQMRKELKK